MTFYCGIDLHSNNNVICIIDDKDKRILEKKLTNQAEVVISTLKPYKKRLQAVAIESTYNWYWLADALIDAGFDVQLVNTAKVVQYEGIKRTDDRYDAFHLAHLMRLGILPTGYICPPEHRGLRDLARRRMKLVQNRSQHIIDLKTQYQRSTGQNLSTNTIKLKDFQLPDFGNPNVQLAMESNVLMIQALGLQIKRIEKSLLAQVANHSGFQLLKTVQGIGDTLANIIVLESGDMARFKKVGHYASYCRCVSSVRMSNGKRKGRNNSKNGNKYLAWAFIEAANFAIRHSEKAKAYYEKKKAATCRVVAIKALAHKLARACYYILTRREPFKEDLLYT